MTITHSPGHALVRITPTSASALTSTLLSRQERRRLSLFKSPDDAVRHASGRVLARQVVAEFTGHCPASIHIDTVETGEQQGRPLVDATGLHPRPHLSISHSGDWAAVAVATTPCGIDIETETAVTLLGRSPDAFTTAELIELRAGTGFTDATRWWTAKEAVAKALGCGFLSPATSPNRLDGRGDRVEAAGTAWAITDLPAPLAHRAALATPADAPIAIDVRTTHQATP